MLAKVIVVSSLSRLSRAFVSSGLGQSAQYSSNYDFIRILTSGTMFGIWAFSWEILPSFSQGAIAAIFKCTESKCRLMKPILNKKEKSVSKSEQMLAALQEQDLALADRYFEQALTTDSEEELLDLADYLESIGFSLRPSVFLKSWLLTIRLYIQSGSYCQ